mgnify:CR=1 FL=1
MKALVVDDEKLIVKGLKFSLEPMTDRKPLIRRKKLNMI